MKSLKVRALWLTIVLISLNLAFSPVFAAGSCKMDGGPTPELSDYIKKLGESINKLQSKSSGSTCKISGTTAPTTTGNLNEAGAAIVRGVNVSLIQNSYLDSAAFTTDLSLKSEVPPALRQHLNLLLKNQETINRAIEQVYRTCAQDIEVPGESVIEGLGTENVRLGKLGEILLTNHIDVLSVYRTSVLGRPAYKDHLLLVPADFGTKLYASYGPDAQQVCRKEGDVFKKIREAIDKISRTAGSISKGMSVWQTSDVKTETAYEESVRQKRDKEYAPKLKKTGLFFNISDAEARNQTNYDTPDKDSGVSGFLQNVWLKTVSTFERIKNFYTFVPKVSDSKNTEDWVARYRNITSLQTNVEKEVLDKYAKLSSQIGDAQLSKDIYEGKLGLIYIELEAGTKFLEPYRKVAKKICLQDQGQNTPAAGCTPGK